MKHLLVAYLGALTIAMHIAGACTPKVESFTPANGAEVLGAAKTILSCEDQAFSAYHDAGREAGLATWASCKKDGGL